MLLTIGMGSVIVHFALRSARLEYGGIAQLGERLNGIQEVSGSIPLISTKKPLKPKGFNGFIFCLDLSVLNLG